VFPPISLNIDHHILVVSRVVDTSFPIIFNQYYIIYSIHWDEKKKGERGGNKEMKKKKILDNQIGRDTKLSISMQSMDQIQFDEIFNSNPFTPGAPYKAL